MQHVRMLDYKHGYQTIEEASKNKDIKTIMEACVLEAKKGILSSFEITAEELDDFVDAPKPNGEEREYITRVALVQLENYPEMID